MGLLIALILALGCSSGKTEADKDAKAKEPSKSASVDDPEEGPAKAPSAVAVSSDRLNTALSAQVASLERQIKTGQRPDPYASLGLINAHEHLMSAKYLDRYLEAARRANVATTVFVASPEFTLMGKGDKGEPGMSENFEALLKAAASRPGEVIPFCTIDPHDPDMLKRLKEHVAAGARGVKIYSGHSNFHDGPLTNPQMAEVLRYLEETGLPVNWHVNVPAFGNELAPILDAYPKLNIMVPHYGVGFWDPKGVGMDMIRDMLRKHPNLFIDTSLGTREILLKGMATMEQDPEVFKALFRDFPDQIIWGTDSVVTGNSEKTPAWYTDVIWATRDQLEKDVFFTDLAAGWSKYALPGRDGDGRYVGLALDEATLRKVYHDNPMRWLKLTESPTPPVAAGQVPAGEAPAAGTPAAGSPPAP